MIKRLLIILLMATTCNAAIVYDRDIYDVVERKYHRSILEAMAFVTAGTTEGQLLYWDATASMWVYADVTKLKWNDITNVLLANTFTDGTFVVSGGEISAGEIINTFGDIDIGGNTLTSWDIYTGQIISHSTTDPQLLLRHTTGVDEAGFYVDSFGDLTITPTRNSIFQPATDSTTFFQVLDADGGLPVFEIDTTNEKIAIGAHPGGIGYSKLLLYGPQANAVGPHIEFMTDEDAYPNMQILPWEHDNVSIMFDAYYDGENRSSDVGSNARIHKMSDLLRFRYDSGVAQGNIITWNDGMVMDLTNGYVGIGGTTSPDSTFQVVGDTKLGADTTHYTEFDNRGAMEMHGDARVMKHMHIGAASWRLGATAPTVTYETIFPTISFNTGQDDEAHYTTHVPYEWDDSADMTVDVHWQMPDDTDNGNVFWKLKYIGVKEGEDPEGAGTEITQLSAGNHPQDEIIVTTFGTKMLAANLERMDDLGLMLWRHGTDGTDDCGEDAELIAIHIHYTMNQLGQPGLIPVTDVLLLDDGASKLLLDDGASFMLIRL